MASLKAKLFTSASTFPALLALLKPSAGVFQWYDEQLPQNANILANGAVVVRQITSLKAYALNGRMATDMNRMQFTIYGVGNDSQNANAIANALFSFLDQFSAGSGIAELSQYSNTIVGDRDFGVAQTQPMTYQRIVDAMIFNNSTV